MHKLLGKKLAIVVNDGAFFLSHRLNVAVAARDAGMKVSICTPLDGSKEEIERLGFQHCSLALSRWGANPLSEVRSIVGLYKLYKKLRPDVVHHVTIKPVIYGSFAAKAAGVPAIVNAISGLGQVFTSQGIVATLRRGLVKFLYRTALSGPRVRVIFQNQDDRACFLGAELIAEPNTLLVRGAGVDLERLPVKKEQDGLVNVLFASRLMKEKGIEEFVAAAKILKERGVPARFVIAGLPIPGNPGSVSIETFAEWKASGLVDCVGYQKEIEKTIQQSQIVCLPSYYGEGIPKILIEAAASGRAIVTTDWPGCREIVTHNVNGLLVKPRSVLELAAALEKLVLDPKLRQEFGQRGRARVEQEGFDEKTVLAQTLGIYTSLLSMRS